MTSILDRKLSLLFGGMTAGAKLENHYVFIELFVQPGFEFVQNCHSGADDVFGDSFMFHGRDLPRISRMTRIKRNKNPSNPSNPW